MAPWLMATLNVLTGKLKSNVIPRDRVAVFGQNCYQVCVIRLGGVSLRVLLSWERSVPRRQSRLEMETMKEALTICMPKSSLLKKVPV